MGALKGSISIRRYTVLDPLPKQDLRAKLTKGIRAHAFQPLDPKSDHDRSVGWVQLIDNANSELRQEDVFFTASGGEQLRLTLRIETLRPPAAEVRRQVAARVQAEQDEQKRKLSKREKNAIKADVVRNLRMRSLPQVKVIDMVWHLDAKKIYFWSQTKGANERFLDLFSKSFGIRIDTEGAARWARASFEPPALANLEPTPELWSGFEGLRPLPMHFEVEADEEVEKEIR